MTTAPRRHLSDSDWATAALASTIGAPEQATAAISTALRGELATHPHQSWREAQLRMIHRYETLSPLTIHPTTAMAAGHIASIIDDTRPHTREEAHAPVTNDDKNNVVVLLAATQGVYAAAANYQIPSSAGERSIFCFADLWRDNLDLVIREIAYASYTTAPRSRPGREKDL